MARGGGAAGEGIAEGEEGGEGEGGRRCTYHLGVAFTYKCEGESEEHGHEKEWYEPAGACSRGPLNSQSPIALSAFARPPADDALRAAVRPGYSIPETTPFQTLSMLGVSVAVLLILFLIVWRSPERSLIHRAWVVQL